MKKEKEKVKTVEEIAKEIVGLLGVKAKLEAKEDRENQAIRVQIETDTPGILIGHHGETIEALQVVLGVIASQRIGEWQRIIVNVGDWRERREETLKNIAQAATQKAKFTGLPQSIYDLGAAERRIIHLFLSSDPDVITESEGEGESRHIVIKPKKK